MSKDNSHERLIDKDKKPAGKKVLETIGIRTAKLWNQLREFLKNNYDFQPELHFLGPKYGWAYKYRRKGKTLCVLFPETKAFTVLVTFGKKEIEIFQHNFSKFNKNTQTTFTNAHQYHDGKWI